MTRFRMSAEMTTSSRRVLAGAAAGFILSAAIVGAGAAADADHGEQLAKRWCASCHIVAPDQTGGADNAPAFASIAKTARLQRGRVGRGF